MSHTLFADWQQPRNATHIYVITIEQGIYIPEYGGVRLEDDILINKAGFEILTQAPKPFELEL